MELIEKIKYQVPIANLTVRLEMEKKGGGFCCPFCTDPVCLLTVSEEKNRFQTAGCEARGAQIELVQQVLRRTKDEAIAWLCAEYGIEEDRLKAEEILKSWQSEKKTVSLDDVFGSGTSASMGTGRKVEDSAIYADLMKACPLAEVASSFLLRRGYSVDLLEKYRLGWVENPGKVFEDLDSKYGKDTLRSAGLLDRRSEFIFNRHRLLFPFYQKDKIVFIRGRRIDDGKPRYLSLTRKTPILYPADLPEDLDDGETLYVMMDIPDCFALLNRGHNAVAVVDYKIFPEEQLESLARFDLVACGDMDARGHSFNRWLLKAFAKWKKDLRVQELPSEFETWSDFILQKKK
ncbi:CHC2 zinc finger domain-containing protein [Acidobacteriota bacterium]